MNRLLGVIADDLTGGMETASMLVAQGVEVHFVTDPSLAAEAGPASVVVVAQKTRVAPVGEALARSGAAAEALMRVGVRQVFFKYCATFDSTDQGNVGPVAERLLDLLDAPYTLYCPSSAELARTVYQGHLFVGSQLVSDSPKRFDPLTPMTDPNLVAVLGRQTTMPVGLLPHQDVRKGPEVLAGSVAAQHGQGIRHFIADAVCEDDLDALAALALDWRLITGNSPLAQRLPALWRRAGLLDGEHRRGRLPAIGGRAAVLAGSCAERTLEQLGAFAAERPVLTIDIADVAAPRQAIDRAVGWALPHLESGPVAVATSASPQQVQRAQAKLGRDGAAGLAEEVLSGLALALREAGVRRLVVAGGETSGSVVEALGIRELAIGRYAGPGIARAVSSGADPIALCLKSGKLGPVDMFLPTLDSMTVEEQ